MKSEIGVGLYSLAGVYGKKDLNQVTNMLQSAYNQGVTYFDTSSTYGNAEEVLGTTFVKNREDIEIATKVSLTNTKKMDLSYNSIIDACKQSLKQLRTDFIDYYQVHFDDPTTKVEETCQGLETLKKSGLIKEYGIGHLPLNRVKEYIHHGNPKTVMIELSPLKLSRYLEYLNLYKQHNLRMITMGSTGRGILTGNYALNHKFEKNDIRNIDPQFRRGLIIQAFKILDKIKEIAINYNKSPVQIALYWILHQEGVYRVLTGPSTENHLIENIGAQDVNLNQADLVELTRFIYEEHNKRDAIVLNDIEEILASRISNDPKGDLIYVLDGLTELNRFDTNKIMTMYKRIMMCNNHSEYRRIRDELKEYKS
ncbi:aldo/keto reductase [Haloplasma contractile]|uniref:1-deoxy-D-xylulose-5-phosphate reductoisomerase protein n=1 Tax=Haloplasma contractile SSD-17B TaxID=1033810 RepID=F7PW66_9MOLU|nr:aldo/keto reductase [Haloplasma contractile]ERJ11274.1 1-deoxy-D-xylulose-5-phosphate reductoisomerase protein [Haloplasma contractile SSD-17B]